MLLIWIFSLLSFRMLNINITLVLSKNCVTRKISWMEWPRKLQYSPEVVNFGIGEPRDGWVFLVEILDYGVLTYKADKTFTALTLAVVFLGKKNPTIHFLCQLVHSNFTHTFSFICRLKIKPQQTKTKHERSKT